MSIEQQAEELARWLEANPGTDPPEGLDPEVLEVVYALRPELAPAPRVTVEDILNSVQSGPLADPEQAIASEHLAEVVPFPPPNASLKEATSNPNLPIDRASNNPLKAFNSRWFLLTASSVALLAAASALLIVVPALQGGFFIQNPSPELAMADSVEKGESTASAKHSVSPPPAPPARGSENRTGNKRDAPRELYTSSPLCSRWRVVGFAFIAQECPWGAAREQVWHRGHRD